MTKVPFTRLALGTSALCPKPCGRSKQCDELWLLKTLCLNGPSGFVQALVDECGMIVSVTHGPDAPELTSVRDGAKSDPPSE